MTDFSGDFVVPESGIVPNSFIVGNWNNAVISINKLPLESVVSFECNRNLNAGAGVCDIKVKDSDQTWYKMIQPQDEIEIFISSNASGMEIGRKVWGGFVDDLQFDISSGEILEIKGKDYVTRLQSQTYTGSPSGQLQAVLNTLMATQVDFTIIGISALLTNAISITSENDTLYNNVKNACDQAAAVFYVDPITRDFVSNYSNVIAFSPDVLVQGANVLRASKIRRNSELLTNSLLINYNTAVMAAPITNTISQTNYGVFSRAFTVGTLANDATASTFATTTVGVRSAPLEGYEIESTLLLYTNPGAYIQTSIPVLSLSNAYQVIDISYTWNAQNGLRSKTILSTQFVDSTLYIADLERRLRLTEGKAYAGV